MNSQLRAQRMLQWLTYLPPLDNVVRSLVLDYFLPHAPIESAIWHLGNRDDLTCLAVYGPSDVSVGVPIAGSTWRNSSEVQLLAAQASAKRGTSWSEDGLQAVVNLNSQSTLIGFLTMRFSNSVANPEQLGEEIEDFSALIALYISLRFLESIHHNGTSTTKEISFPYVRKPILTDRQMEVLIGISLKKTNNAIASELGYSVSTIRHETMRIFEILGVSNRIDAASYATTLGLI